MGTARDEIRSLAEELGLSQVFPPEVEAEVAALLGAPGLDDPGLEDATGLAYVTIDNEDSRDLDQALYVERVGDGHRLCYALADASFYVRPGSQLFREALSRGASYYLPGLVVPMLPVALSEGLVSLNPGVVRRALVFDVDLDPAGAVVACRVVRQRIRSRAKLSYAGVQGYWDARDAGVSVGHYLENRDFSASLLALREVGRRRMSLAEAQGVISYARIEVDIGFTDAEGRTFHAFESRRYECDRCNEQLSLLVNVEGARLLERASARPDAGIAGIYRVHPAPPPAAFEALAATTRALSRTSGHGETLAWDPDIEPLAAWLSRVTQTLGRSPLAVALQRQALLVNNRSTFTPEPGLHYGVGAPCYARFSSPMREVVGIHTHREALEALGIEPVTLDSDAERDAIVAAANRSKELQHTLTKRANQLVIAALLSADLELAPTLRPERPATVLGVLRDRLYVLLDEPPLELKVYARDLGEPSTLRDDITLIVGHRAFTLGDRVLVRVSGYDPTRDRFALEARPLATAPSP